MVELPVRGKRPKDDLKSAWDLEVNCLNGPLLSKGIMYVFKGWVRDLLL